MKPAPRKGLHGAASAEWLVVAPAVLAVGFGVLQWALLMQGRANVEYAAFQGARAGATRHAEPEAILEGLALGLVGIRGAALTSVPVSLGRVAASTVLREELASGVAAWRQRRPAPADFDDWAVPARDDEGRALDGIVEIPNDNLRYRDDGVGPLSGRSLVEANVLEIEFIYAWPMRVPLIGSLAVRWMEWLDRCDGAVAPAAGYNPWGRADWRIEGGAWRCPYYRAGGVPRWPLRVVASARMHSPARHAASASPMAQFPGARSGAGGGSDAGHDGDASEAGNAGEAGGAGDNGDATGPGAGREQPAPAPRPGDEGDGDGDGDGENHDSPAVAQASEAVAVTGRADIFQPGECFADSGQAVVDVGDQETALAAAVETLAAETVAVQAR